MIDVVMCYNLSDQVMCDACCVYFFFDKNVVYIVWMNSTWFVLLDNVQKNTLSWMLAGKKS